MAVYNANGDLVTNYKSVQNFEVFVASSTADSSIKANADYVCSGANDEVILQQAINAIANKGGGTLRLSNGTFNIGSFPNTDSANDHTALLLPQATTVYNITIEGASLQYGWGKTASVSEGTVFEVTEECYESLSSDSNYTMLRAGYVASLMNTPSNVCLVMRGILFRIPSNQKKITCLDNLYTNRVLIEQVQFRAYKPNYDGYTSGVPKVALTGCVAMRSMGGSNSGCLADYRNITCFGFYEGFKMGSEHIIAVNLSAIYCVYGYTFGNYEWANGFVHPITMINCCDERNINLPLFVDNGWKTSYSQASYGGPQAITMIDFNIERVANQTPSGVLGEQAKEVTEGKFVGRIEYTMTRDQFNTNSTGTGSQFWEHGSGHGFITRNQAHALTGTSIVRRSYAPNYLQQFYDTTVNKMLWCIDTANKTWVDSQGNTVA